jgi:segregation and condensation protein B
MYAPLRIRNDAEMVVFLQNNYCMDYLSQHIESIIFTAEQPIALPEIQQTLEEAFGLQFHLNDLEANLQQLKARYQGDLYAFEIVEIADGYQFMTKAAYHATVGAYLKQTMQRRLSRAALETLSIVAYRQPVSKSDIERIRGVNCDYALQKLLEKELVSITGRSDGPGRPLLYGTGQKFMDYFGLKSIKDLPQLKEFQEAEQTIGEPET